VTPPHKFDDLLSDEELRARLESGDTLVFLGKRLGALESQVERLGLADRYFVSVTEGPHGETTRSRRQGSLDWFRLQQGGGMSRVRPPSDPRP
jgi:hypothetical protein